MEMVANDLVSISPTGPGADMPISARREVDRHTMLPVVFRGTRVQTRFALDFNGMSHIE